MTNKKKWFPPKMYTILTALFAVAVLNIFFSVGVSIGQVAIKPQTTAIIEPGVKSRLVATHTVQYVEIPVTITEYVEQIKRVPVELRNFNDLEELERWMVAVDINTTTVYFQLPDAPVDCDDYALALQSKALTNGYILSFEIISRTEYNAAFRNQLPSGQSLHAINLAIIGNSAYYIEPQTGEVAFAVHLD